MDKIIKHSKQRDALLSLLKNVKSHPSAEWLHSQLKADFPNLSLATVYRNLNLLCELGEVRKIEVGDGTLRFDGHTANHYHFLCSGCNGVIDVSDSELSNINNEIESKYGVRVDTHSVVFFGKCHKCIKNII